MILEKMAKEELIPKLIVFGLVTSFLIVAFVANVTSYQAIYNADLN